MSERCLRQGSRLVPATFDLLRLYSMRFCPFAQRTRLVLAHKKIPHEIINVNLKYKPTWFLERNPYGLVPIIEYKGKVIYESAICDEFLDDLFPEPRLLPECSFKKSGYRLLLFDFDKAMVPSFYKLLSRNQEKRENGLTSVLSLLDYYERLLQEQGTSFFQGDSVGMVDFHFWPWFERLPAVRQLNGIDIPSASTHPRLNQWISKMEQLEAVQQVKYPLEWYAGFFMSFAQREPDYDIGLYEQARL